MSRSEAIGELNDEYDNVGEVELEEAIEWQSPHIKVSAEIKRILKRKHALSQLKGSINFVEARPPDYYDYGPSQRQSKKLRLHRDSYAELLRKTTSG